MMMIAGEVILEIQQARRCGGAAASFNLQGTLLSLCNNNVFGLGACV